MVFRTPRQTPALQYTLAIVLSIAPTIFTALRFRARIVKRVRFDWDDWLILIALVFVYITAIFLVVGTALGLQGQHMTFLPSGAPDFASPRYVVFLKMLYAGQLSQIFAIGPTKISVLLLYRRIFRGKTFGVANWTLIALVTGWIVAFFFANLLECVPITEAFKNAPGLGGNPKCINAVPMYLAQVYSDVVLDVLILVLPIPPIWKLQMPLKQKWAVSGIFLLGVITVLASCAKMIIFNYVGHELEKEPDVSYFLSPITYWPLIEASLQIIAACLTMLRPFVEDWRLIFSSKGAKMGTGYMKSTQSTRALTATEDGTIVKTIDVVQDYEMNGRGSRGSSRRDGLGL